MRWLERTETSGEAEMPVRHLKRIFEPRSVAVFGAGPDAGSVGGTVLKNLVDAGFAGAIYPVNPKHEQVEGLKCYARAKDLPEPADLGVICTPARTVPGLVRECGEAGVLGIIIISAGFREAGPAGEALQKQIAVEAAKFDGMRIVGPNCLGVISPLSNLNASFAAAMPEKGRVAFLSQSGALCTSVLDWALQANVGFSHFVSVGNMMDVGIGQLIDYFAMDGKTESILMYVESISQPREFMSAARAFARSKPIIAYKAGRFAESAKAAASHTGAMAGMDAVYEAAFERAGIVRVFEMEDMFTCAQLLAHPKTPRGARLAIVTNAGGPGVMATDSLLERNGVLAQLSPQTLEALNENLPPAWSHGNPVDVLGDASPERYAKAVSTVLADPGVDAVLVILTPQAMTDPTGAAQSVLEAAQKSIKPVLAVWMGGASVADGIILFQDASVPCYNSPEQAVRAFMYLVSYARIREMLYETPRDLPVEFPLDRGKLRAVFDTILAEGQDILSESTSKALLDAYEIPVTKPYAARSADDAVQLSNRIGYPVAMKIWSPEISHKTDVGGVMLNLATDRDVTDAYERMTARAKAERPDAHIAGVTVQKMFAAPISHELIVGAKRDPTFGVVLMVGAGGITAELYRDRALGLPPLNERLARWMLESLRSWPLLKGYRGRPPVAVDKLIEVMMRLSYLVADYPEIAELDINPLVVTPEGVIALDARVVLDRAAVLNPPRPYSHLAIPPYPEQYERKAKLKSGLHVLLRPIKPEDEPMWHALLAACSQESIWFRFRYLFKHTTHEMATRFCFIDYDREIGIVAEIEEDGARKLIGVGRVVADADHTDAEYAVLVADAYQGIGLGSLLTDYCMEICNDWGIQRIVAETSPDNKRMLGILEQRNFGLEFQPQNDVVLANKTLTG
jgi:acetyltransferase